MQRGRLAAASLLTLLLITGLAGCLGGDDADPVDTGSDDLDLGEYVMEGEWSMPRQPAVFEKGPVEKFMVPVRDGVEIAIGVFWPDVPGCDWTQEELPEACALPVVMDGGPYYTDRLDIDKRRPLWGDWLIPRGYIYVQMALRGTGESGGCMGFKAPQDVDDAYDVIDWVSQQPWSSGRIGMAGRSYDGTTAWAGAASGHPALKTIVPISGAVDAPDLYFRNGTHELRALIPHIPTYWAMYAVGAGGDDPAYRGTDVVANVCPEVAEAHVEGPLGAATGDASSAYWQSRDISDEVLENFQGSAWVIHGLLDWNVNPSQAVPFIDAMIDAGIPTRAWLGQWAHNYPDNTIEHPENPRWDWSDQLVTWFDHYLKGHGDEPWLGVEAEQDDHRWRREATYPPVGETRNFTATVGVVTPGNPATTADAASFEDDIVIAGLTLIHADVTPSSSTGGALFAEVFAGDRRIGWSSMDLRYYAGGNTEPAVLTPGTTVTARMWTEPMDSFVPAGTPLTIRFSKDGVEDINPSVDPSPVIIESVTVTLPVSTSTDYVEIPLPEGDPRRKA